MPLSVLRPLLYSLYTHDPTAIHSSNVLIKFAIDMKIMGLISIAFEAVYSDSDEVQTLSE